VADCPATSRRTHARLTGSDNGYPDVMEGGIAIFLLFLIIVVGLALAVVLGGLGGGVEAINEKRAGRRRQSRPTHAVVADDGSSSAQPDDRPRD
jgi:hypothetical protein